MKKNMNFNFDKKFILFLIISLLVISSMAITVIFVRQKQKINTLADELSFTTQSSTPTQDVTNFIQNVKGASGYRYGAQDDKGVGLDTIKIIQNPSGGYLGVYHTFANNAWVPRLAKSTDLLHWQYVITLDIGGSQPYLNALPDGGFLLTYEKHVNGGNHVQFRYYANLDALSHGHAQYSFFAPHTLSGDGHAEGTPNIYSVRLSPDILHSTIVVGFHYNRSNGLDREARGTLTDFHTWQTQQENTINHLFESQWNIAGNVGDRDSFFYAGRQYNIIEAERSRDNFGTWSVYLYDYLTNTLQRLAIATHHGSNSIANPSYTNLLLPDGKPGFVTTEFIFSEGAAGGENGELIYYGHYTNTQQNTPPVSLDSSVSPTTDTGSVALSFPLSFVHAMLIQGGGNTHPVHPNRPAKIIFLDANGKNVGSQDIIILFDNMSGRYKAVVKINLPAGAYTLQAKIPGFLPVTSEQFTVAPSIIPALSQLTLIPGDLNDDGKIDILDYNLLIRCYGKRADTSSCKDKAKADLNDDGVVDGVDYNIFLRYFILFNS